MFKRNVKGNTRTKLVAGAVLLSLGLAAGSAMATNVYGGGATLPAGAYVGFDFLSTSPTSKISTNTTSGQAGATISATSLFGAYAATSGNKVSYCQTGSGNGKKIFDHYDGTNVLAGATGTCDGTTAGFGAGTGAAVDPHFAGSDAPMSSAEFGWFANGGKTAANGQPVQFPAVAGSIALIYNNADVASLDLTEAQVCGIFDGSITNWTQLGSSVSKPIKVAFRSDGSGTTFSLANHLAAACPGTAARHFVVDQAFSTAVSLQTPTVIAAGIPASGNPAVVDAVNANDGAIGYAESANLLAAQNAGLDSNVEHATIAGLDPYTNFPASLNLTLVVADRVITGADPTTGAAVLGTITPVVSSATGCMVVATPSAYANVSGRYPIMAVSYLIANHKGNGADLSAVQGLVSAAYNKAGLTTLGSGYAFVNPGTVTTGKVNTCITL